jgi:predicted house-cleaning noncanonical NTP pyrophosphatase (MazG superfamily)
MQKTYNKLVRDKLIDICELDILGGRIKPNGYHVRYVEREELLTCLKDKLLSLIHI